jgi:protein TonB
VVLLHLGGVWALQAGLLQRAAEVLVPAHMLGDFIEPVRPKVEPAPVPKPVARPVVRTAVASPAPMPLAVADSSPSPNAPTGVLVQAAVPSPLVVAPVVATGHTESAATAAPLVELPSSDAQYLHNPKPSYPPQSRRMGEQGKVVVRVLIGADGVVQKAEIRQSSGFARLDVAALATVQAWRYVPGKRGGVPEAMWFSVPINYVLE